MNVVLTIAGSDSGGGAGIQADLKTFEAFGCFGTSAITAVTAQNTRGVTGVWELPAAAVIAQIDAVLEDFDVAAIKIGMLANESIVRAVAERLARLSRPIPIVLDPVMVATSGDRLLAGGAVEALRDDLMPLALLATPNRAEAELLAEHTGEAVAVLERLAGATPGAILLTGGDEPMTDEAGRQWIVDYLRMEREIVPLRSRRVDTDQTHGTGCTLSSAIAAGLADGAPLREAIATARDYVADGLRRAPGLGRGRGPLRHGGGRA